MADPTKGVTDDDIRSLMFGDYLSKGKEEKFYDEILNLNDLKEVSWAMFGIVSVYLCAIGTRKGKFCTCIYIYKEKVQEFCQ